MADLFQSIYYYFRLLGIEGILHFAYLSYVLWILCTPKKVSINKPLYILGSTAIFAAFQWIFSFVIQYSFDMFLSHSSLPYWFNFVLTFTLATILSGILLSGSIIYKITYILFFQTFILLFKVSMSPLYLLEASMPALKYEALDIVAIIVLLLLLYLLTLLFKRHRLHSTITLSNKSMFFALYFPLSILICYTLSSNIRLVHQYSEPLTAFIILSILPMVYYILCTILDSYEEQRLSSEALMQTKAQLARYRFSIELEDRIKKERHELKNNYFYIQTLLKEKKYDVLDEYLNNVVGEKLLSLNEINSGNSLMDYILNRKVAQAHKYNIKTYVEVLVPQQMNISEDLLCTILLNLLDNAIEASQREDNPDIQINISYAQSYLVAIIKNKTSSNVLETNPELLTTKSDSTNHGQGMKIIRQSVHRANGILKFSYENGYFVASVMLPIN
ncbi:MAG: GHKL domain-containing protein [Pseudobutyrivibrio sp.]|nr:GHKL domain-containing protein [Pseudobutyrivibrio sp.]